MGVNHHEPLGAMGPVEWEQVPQDDLEEFLADVLSETQTVVESIPAPAKKDASSSAGRARSKTESAASAPDIKRALTLRQKAEAIGQAQDLQKEWKEIKVSAKENPLGINVYKLSAKDGRGAWFARRSVHEGLSFDDWKKGLSVEFSETMKVQGAPGSGNIRGIGADKRVEDKQIGDHGQLQVFQLSAQFPGPTAPRDFVTLLLTSETSVKPAQGSRPLRQYMIVSKPCEHPECPPRQGIIRGYYESIEVIREVPVDNFASKRSLSSADLLNRDEGRIASPKPGSEGHGSMPLDEPATAVEWLMVTRSDPGGSVPRFLIEKGTPPGIVGDAGKFLKWVTSKAMHGFAEPEETGEANKTTDVTEASITNDAKSTAPPNPTANLENTKAETAMSPNQDDPFPGSNGLYGVIAGAIGAASSYIPTSLLKTWGTGSDFASAGSPIRSSTRAIRTARAIPGADAVGRTESFEATRVDSLSQLLNSIQAREIRVVPNAFNSTQAFLAYFEAAAQGSISLVLLDLVSATKRVGASLDAMRSELEIANVARVQGWGHGGFGAYVHGFVQNEMAAVDGAQDGQHHFLYVWHPDSDWHPAFEGRQAEDPLGPAFGGYHHDLATICIRMRADREALVATTDYGRAAVFHLVIPAYYPLVMDHPIAFADELLPLVVTGAGAASRH